MKTESRIKKLALTLSLSVLVLASGNSAADDTEIYFSTGSSSATGILRPNILFILDTSGSMAWDATGTNQSRMQVLKEAMADIVGSVEDINLGLMRFTNDDGGPILFPIRYIDAPARDTVGEPSGNPSFNNRISNGNNDAEQSVATGAVVLSETTLDIAQTSGTTTGSFAFSTRVNASNNDAEEDDDGDMLLNGSILDMNSDNIPAVRFTNITVPKGATITSAFLDFWVYNETDDGNVDADVRVQIVDNATAFNSNDDDITSRNFTTGNDDVEWDDVPDPNDNEQVTSPDIKSLVQRIVNRSGWNPGQAMVFAVIKEGGNSRARQWHSFDGTSNVNLRPRLTINYSVTTTLPAVDQLTMLRFENVQIPQGATVTEANLALTPQVADSNTADWIIYTEAADNSAALAATVNNLSGRSFAAATTNWSVPATTANVPITSPSLISLVQEVVDRPDWCGGNAISLLVKGSGLRRIKSTEQSASQAPQFNYTYEAGSSTGCYNQTDTAQIATGNDDAEEDEGSGDVDRNSNDMDFDDDTIVGIRFQNIQVPNGATILGAAIQFTARESDTNSITFNISGHDTDDASGFGYQDDDISDRINTTANVNWTPTNWSTDTAYRTPDISNVVTEVTSRGGWVSGNDMVFIFEPASGSGDRHAYSVESSATKAARLLITYQSQGGTEIKTVRQRLLEIIAGLPADGSTPVIETLYEAAQYWRGNSARYGKSRDNSSGAELSHPGSYCTDNGDGTFNCNGADTANHPPFGIDYESGCDPATEWYTSDCNGTVIDGSPTYISPFTSTLSCQQNYQVLLTDGEANSSDSGIRTDIANQYNGGTACATVNGAGNNYATDEVCGYDIAKTLFEVDNHATLDNEQNVKTFTIAFNLDDEGATQFLQDIATGGSGGIEDAFFAANNATELTGVFTSILTEVKSDPTSFVAPSLATNAFNRLLSRDEVYFGLFTPSLEKKWFGNVKKYNICISSDGDDPSDPDDDCTLGEILDYAHEPAVDPINNKFKETARSVWSDLIDGQATTLGGVGGEMTDYTQRLIYTDATVGGTAPAAGTSLDATTNPGFQIDVDTWNDAETDPVRDLVCGPYSGDISANSECEDRMLWLLGKVIVEDDDTDINANTRWTVNDVLHSSPTVITYGGSDDDANGTIDTFFDKIVFGTNDGGLRMVNGTTGDEEWEFLPQSKLEGQQQLFDNIEGEHIYGMDVTPTLHIRDVDADGFIEPGDGDFIYVIATMRRGGNFIYALDVTDTVTSTSDTVVPKFLWRIEGGTGDFTRLGQTWSQPRIARIFTTDGTDTIPRDVLIFGGGYDQALDGNAFGIAATSNNDNDGNALYIVDPATGELILSISGNATAGQDADIEVAAMEHSIPGRVTVLDTDGDGFDDRLYFGDTGGQIWRVDLGNTINPDAATPALRAGSTVVGRLANVSTAGTPAEERRFFEPPSVIQVKDTEFSDAANGEYDYVLIGSGWRAHPLNKDADDRFYAFRDETIGKMVDANTNNLADSYPAGITPPGTPIANSNMIDITNQLLDSENTAHVESSGWYFDFTSAGSDGEKVLSAPITLAGTVFFSTYAPDESSSVDLCAAQVGGGNAYNLNILNTRATIDWDDVDGVDPLDDRKLSLGGGIPSDVVPVFTEEGIVGIVGIEGGAAQLGTLSGLPRFRTYWYEESEQ